MSATPFGQNWPTSWTTDSVLNGTPTVAAGAYSSNSATIANYGASPNEVLDTEITVDVAYGATITGGGAIVYICRRTRTGWESPANDSPASFTVPVVASTTRSKTVTVPGLVGDFQVVVFNPATNSTITPTLASRPSQGQSG